MRYLVLAIVTAIATLGAVLLASMGMDYIDTGYGLHPAVAFPLVTLIGCVYIVLFFLCTSIEDEPKYLSNDDDLMVKHY